MATPIPPPAAFYIIKMILYCCTEYDWGIPCQSHRKANIIQLFSKNQENVFHNFRKP